MRTSGRGVGTLTGAGVTATLGQMLFDRSLWLHEHRQQHTSMPWAATKKALHLCGGDTIFCPGPYLKVACAEFHIGCRSGKNFSLYSHIYNPLNICWLADIPRNMPNSLASRSLSSSIKLCISLN